MSHVKLYEDINDRESMMVATEAFLNRFGYFEASSWCITKYEDDGTLVETCCYKHDPVIYESLEEWFDKAIVYPDQYQYIRE